MGEEFIKVEGLGRLRQKLLIITNPEERKKLNTHVGSYVLERVKDHLDEMSVERHKVADRLGAPHTRYLEYASGRVAGTSQNGEKQDTIIRDITPDGSTIAIQNTPALRRAFGDMHITPKRAKALTIPLHRIAYAKRVKDLRNTGHDIFRPRGTNILAENDGTEESYTDPETGKRKKRKRIRPLYCLVKSTTVPKDEGLLPTRQTMEDWAADATDGYVESLLI